MLYSQITTVLKVIFGECVNNISCLSPPPRYISRSVHCSSTLVTGLLQIAVGEQCFMLQIRYPDCQHMQVRGSLRYILCATWVLVRVTRLTLVWTTVWTNSEVGIRPLRLFSYVLKSQQWQQKPSRERTVCSCNKSVHTTHVIMSLTLCNGGHLNGHIDTSNT